ncbi:MAG: hypothetical protein Q7S65_05135 [Nanoarchaeota archaeon]|nr:hypothetical protein [Nanoarchaeota archaeon]
MKRPISATIDEQLVSWIETQCKDKMKYRNKSHLIEIALDALKRNGK